MTSTLPAEFRQTATSRPAVHRSLMVDSFPHGGAGADHSHDISATHSSSMARSYRKKLHDVIMFLITTLGGYVQVEYLSNTKSPIDAHSAIMTAIVVHLCLYAVSMIAEFQLEIEESSYVAIVKKFGPLVGFLAVVLLLIIINPLVGTIASFIWFLFVLEAAFTSYPMVWQCLCEVFSGIRSHFEHVDENASPVQSQVENV